MPDITKPQDTKPTATQASAPANEAARQGARTAQQGGQATAEAVRQGANATAELTRQGAEVGAEVLRRTGEGASETARRSAQAVAEGQRQIAQDAASKFEETSRKLAEAAQGGTETLRGLMTLSTSAKAGLQDVQQSLVGLVEGMVQTNLHAAQALTRLANPVALIELQQRFAREYMDALMQGTATLIHAVRRTADETLRPLEQQVEQRRQASQGQHFQHAAE